MIFSTKNSNGNNFKDHAIKSLDRAKRNYSLSKNMMEKPYYSFKSHVRAFTHPFYHATQLLRNIGQLLYGVFIVANALIDDNSNATDNIGYGMLMLSYASILEILNIFMSIISLATRLIASICNTGYVSTKEESRINSFQGLYNVVIDSLKKANEDIQVFKLI